MQEKQENKRLNLFRLAAAFLVVAIHISPLEQISQNADFFLTRILARTAVPFFFMVTGQFLFVDAQKKFSSKGVFLIGNSSKVKKRVRKLFLFYGGAILLYLPVGLYADLYKNITTAGVLRMLFFDGTFYHLWYFPACITGILLVFLLLRFLSVRAALLICSMLYLIGLFGDSYYGLIKGIPVINAFYNAMFQVFSYTRNGLFLAPLFLLLGAMQNLENCRFSPSVRRIGLAFCLLALTAEGFTLHSFALQRHDSMYVALVPCMLFLYQCLLSCKSEGGRIFRPISAWIYLLHPAVIIAVRALARITKTTPILVENPLIHYITVCCLTLLVSSGLVFLYNTVISRMRSENSQSNLPAEPSGPMRGVPANTRLRQTPEEIHFPTGRAWIELNRSALEHNVEILHFHLPPHCRLMPAVKADAYGHGAVWTCRVLNECGVDAFCVASIQEGITLREHDIRGEILILGYTHPRQFPLLCRYHLTQTVLDLPYARELEKYGNKIHVHIGIDTGMHRLGERVEHTEVIRQIYRIKNLCVDGLFTHLCVSDTNAPSDRAYTRAQAQALYSLVEELKKEGLPCPKVHLQASYGILNYPEFVADYARPGILLYGMLSTRKDTLHCPLPLMPVLSLKARVASVRNLYSGEAAGYGLQFVAAHDMKIAALAIGYADGLPRSLSCGAGAVLIHGHRAPIIGRICMDQTLVDVSEIPDVVPGSIAVIIGSSGEKEITACDLAEQAQTITNEILSRLGTRLERVEI